MSLPFYLGLDLGMELFAVKPLSLFASKFSLQLNPFFASSSSAMRTDTGNKDKKI